MSAGTRQSKQLHKPNRRSHYDHALDFDRHRAHLRFGRLLMGLFSLVGLLASLVIGVLVGALAGYIAGRFMGTETSFARNAVLGVLGSFVGEFLFGLVGIHATGSFSSFVISILGACVCIWVDNKLFKKG